MIPGPNPTALSTCEIPEGPLLSPFPPWWAGGLQGHAPLLASCLVPSFFSEHQNTMMAGKLSGRKKNPFC